MRVLLVNDDGPPAPHSPHILGLYEYLTEHMGWEVSVVIPSSQKSWGSMAFTLHPPCSAWFYYPLRGNYDGSHPRTKDCWSDARRPVRDEELGEWIVVDGSPTTCTNVGLHTLEQIEGEAKSKSAFDLVVSGPNFGRNTGTAFSLCSGTIGAALAASLSGVRAISISYAHFQQPTTNMQRAAKEYLQSSSDLDNTASDRRWGYLPPSAPPNVVQRAHQITSEILNKLWQRWEDEVGVYTINVPLSHLLMDDDKLRIYWTKTWDSRFGPLYTLDTTGHEMLNDKTETSSSSSVSRHRHKPSYAPLPKIALRFAPNMQHMMQPSSEQSSDSNTQTDIWAISNGFVSIARLNASYTNVSPPGEKNQTDQAWPGTLFKL